MATSSFPFDNQDTTEDQFSRLFRELQSSGVADTRGGSGLRVSATGGMDLSIEAGFAIVRGHGFYSTATELKTLPAATTSTVIHLIVLRLDPTANTITLEVVSGVSGGGTPALTQTDTGIYEIPLASIEVAANAVNIDPAKITDLRAFLGTPPTAWTSVTQPTSPRLARLGYNASSGQWEYWTGSEWKALIAPDTYSRLTALETQPYIRRRDATNLNDGTYTIQNQTSTTLDWETADAGSGITYDPVTGRFTPSKAGSYWYEITITYNEGASPSGRRHLSLYRSGSLMDDDIREPVPSSHTTLRLSGEVYVAAGQYLTVSTYILAGGFLGMVSGQAYQRLAIRRVGP